jgi:phenylalanyl-tRNA synthetase beta chain
MKIPYRWIREFVDLELSAEAAADRLVNAGVEVASVTPVAPADLRGVVVGEIEAVEHAPGESEGHRLVVCRVSTGARRFAVVCGAPNAAPGVRAAFAPPDAVLPGGRRIGTATIRGVASEGMLCSERELGLGEAHEEGILTLDADAPLGADLLAHLGLDDRVLEIEVTPNRPDCLSVVGVARELAALTGGRFRPPRVAIREAREPAHELARVRIEAPDLCHRYTARVVSDVTVGPSPAWLAARLRACGLRPISNVVDVTNYVMWEQGHPLHAFDRDTVTDATIVVRQAHPGERLTTLDGQERALDPAMLLIADPKRGIGLAGVMGGANTEVSDSTTGVLLEAAWFLPASVRRTARALGLASDAAYRFERGADIEGLLDASARAAQLIAAVAGGRVARGVIDVYPRRRRPRRVRLRMARVERVLGVAPPRATARRILSRLGLTPRDRGGDLDVAIPSFRRGLAMEDDLVEEVIRVWGYDKIPSTLPGGALALVREPETLRQERTVRDALVAAGLTEAITYSFSDPVRAEALGTPPDGAPAALLNPLSREASLLRRHPLEGVLGVVATNLRRQQPNVRVFEVAKTYARADGAPRETRVVAVALAGLRHDPAWSAAGGEVDVYDAKGLAEHVLDVLGLDGAPREGGRLPGFEADCQGALAGAGGAVLAEYGEVAVAVRRAFAIDAPVFAAVVPLDPLLGRRPPPARHRPLPRFPAVQRDLAFAVAADQEVTAAAVEATIRAEAGSLLRHLALFDVFTFPDGRRSLAWRLTFQAEDRTLTDEEVNAVQARLARTVAERWGVTWRTG